MARTKADGGGSYRKVLAARAPRKVLGCSRSVTGRRGGARGAGAVRRSGPGPAACARPTPAWQRGIAEFLHGAGERPAPRARAPPPAAPGHGASQGEEGR